jgi:NADH-quinone oxidoreductase subunit L
MDALPLIPLLPGVGALLLGLAGIRYFPKRATALVACGTMTASFLLSVRAVAALVARPPESRDYVVTLATWVPPLALPTSAGPAVLEIPWAFRLDPLAAVMILVVTGIGLLIHVYATGYMHEETDGAYARFFSYLNLFCFFMLTLVLASNFLVLFVGWEGVGLCSYLLIGYWYQKKSAADAGKKAFIVNRIGDFGFMLGMFLIFDTFGTLDFRGVAAGVAARPVETAAFGTLSLAALLLFVGATGKSAQIPLYVWLPDAMEGPTPVSALIHAATMVTAGVYMVCRNAVLFSHAPAVMAIVATIGVLTALVAASIGLVQNDIKRVLAYSTVSQLGYMFLATGVGAFAAGAFHLMTHAFFKALLFLGSGAVIHAMAGEQDMQRMGGLRRYLPVTFATMMVGTLAIAGVPPLSGFFSKDEILYRAFLGNRVLWTLAVVTAGMTAFYMFRLMALTFYGAYRGPAWSEDPGGHGHAAGNAHHGGPPTGGHGHAWHGPHEAPRVMTVPLVLLAVGAAVAGFVGVPAALGGSNAIEHFLAPSFTAPRALAGGSAATASAAIPVSAGAGHAGAGPGEVAAHVPDASGAAHAPPAAGSDPGHDESRPVPDRADEAVAVPAAAAGALPDTHGEAAHLSAAGEIGLMVLSVAVALAGIAAAWRVYVQRPELAERLAARFPRAHRVLTHKYYVDELYGATAVRGTIVAALASWRLDQWVVDGLVNAFGWMTRAAAWLSGLADRHAVDGLVDGTGRTLYEASFGFRRLQTGLVQTYALLIVGGVFALVSLYLFVR